jgi:hypothetical protein
MPLMNIDTPTSQAVLVRSEVAEKRKEKLDFKKKQLT